jgi:hypothetical protein
MKLKSISLPWVFLTACVVILASWAISLRNDISLGWRGYVCSLSDGLVRCWEWDNVEANLHLSHRKTTPYNYGFAAPRGYIRFPGGSHAVQWFVVPLWIIFVPSAFIAFLLFHRSNRFPKNCCSTCGYNLTGNVSGVCSECGTPAGDRKSQTEDMSSATIEDSAE